MNPIAATSTDVIPAKAGIHFSARAGGEMDTRLRGNDTEGGAALLAINTAVIPAKAGIQGPTHDIPAGTTA